MGVLVFAVVSVAALAGLLAWAILVVPLRDPDGTSAVGLLGLPLPALAAVFGFRFVARDLGGRTGLASLVVFLGSLASTVLAFSVAPGLVLVVVPVLSAAFGLLARRMLDVPSGA
jgi:hypothetical protein